MDHDKYRFVKYCAILFIIALGTLFRAMNIDSTPVLPDEAESSVNALTILEKGYPLDRYLGLPIYENMLMLEWPDHPEYEFKDLSYSSKGFAIYHGWFPLYAMAGSFFLSGIPPDESTDSYFFRQNVKEFKKRNIAARMPSIVFSVIFMILMYLNGRAIGGSEGAFSALIIAAFHTELIRFGWQARYYSATLALTAGICLLIMRVYDKGRWRHFMILGGAFVLLFHTHILSFFITFLVFCCLFPKWIRHQQGIWKISLMAGILIIGIAPWILWTGFLERLGQIPAVRNLLIMPDDLLYINKRYVYIILCWIAAIFVVTIFGKNIPSRFRISIDLLGGKSLLFLLWLTIGITSFYLLIPTASFFPRRLTLLLLVPGWLVAVIFSVFLSRLILGKASLMLSPLIILCFLYKYGNLAEKPKRLDTDLYNYAPCEILSTLDLSKNTRFYATPSDHLVLTFYTGLPFQSIAPVRKKFLDSFEGDIVFVANSHLPVKNGDPIHWKSLMESAEKYGSSLSEFQARELSRNLAVCLIRESLLNTNAINFGYNKLVKDNQFIQNAYDKQQELNQARLNRWILLSQFSPLIRSFDLHRRADFWPIFFYRYVDPDSRRGGKLNYIARFRKSPIYIDPRWIVRISSCFTAKKLPNEPKK